MAAMTVLFSHGLESGPWGTKIRSMAELARARGATVDSIDYQGLRDPDARVQRLVEAAAGFDPGRLVLVGSSMGGHVATAAAETLRPAGVFVLAPAFYMPGYESLTPGAPGCPMAIVHGWRDDVVPVDNSIRYARACRASLHLIDGDHRLTEQLGEINELLGAFLDRIDRTHPSA
jgi:pimeloyl-ACP methyl ester carboxylesterase